MSIPDYSYLGSGRIYMRDLAVPNQPMIELGNCSALAFSIQEDVQELKSFTTPGGGTQNEVRRISAVECSITMHDLIAANLARAVNGTTSTVAGAIARTNQAMGTGARGAGQTRGFVPFPEIVSVAPAPVVRAVDGRTAITRANTTAYAVGQYLVPAAPNGFFYRVTTAGTTAATPPTFNNTMGATTTDGTATLTFMGRIILSPAGVDYDLRSSGVLLTTAALYTDGEALEADYTTVAQDLVQALVQGAREYEMFFDGLNEARSSKRVTVRAFRVRLGAAQNLGLIGEEFAALEVTGKLLADTTRAGGLSQFFATGVEQ